MAAKYWLGQAAPVAQVNTLTVAGAVGAGDVYSVTMNTKVVSYTADGTETVDEVAEALAALLQEATIAEFAEVTWTQAAAVITGTATTAGVPFVNTSATTGAGTFVTATTTASAGPNHWDDVDNWSGNTLPVNGDAVYIRETAVSILYGIDQNAVTLLLLDIDSTFTGKIGLLDFNGAIGSTSTYSEYREKRLKIGATTINIGRGSGGGSGRIRLNTGAVQTTLNVYGTGSPEDSGRYVVDWIGTHASNKIVASRGSVAASYKPGDTSVVATAIVGSRGGGNPVQALFGDNCTLTALTMTGGNVEVRNGFSTAVMTDGTLTITGTAGVTTSLDAQGGLVNYDSSGTLVAYNGGTESLIDFSRVNVARTVTTCILTARAGLRDPGRTVTFGGSGVLVRCRNSELQEFDLGENNYYQRTPA